MVLRQHDIRLRPSETIYWLQLDIDKGYVQVLGYIVPCCCQLASLTPPVVPASCRVDSQQAMAVTEM